MSAREHKPPHFLTIILEVARLAPENSGGWSIVLSGVSRCRQSHKFFVFMFSIHLLSERVAFPPLGNAPPPP